MTIIAPAEASRFATDIARIAFSMFAYVADIEKSITAHDVRRFQALLKETAWVENDDVRAALLELRQNYSSFWADYDDRVFAADGGAIASGLDRLHRDLGEHRGRMVRQELNRFLERLDYSVKLNQGDQRARSQARKELLAILRMDGEASADMNRKDVKSGPQPLETATTLTPLPSAATPSSGNSSVWRSGKKRVRCVSVVLETHDTKTYSFVAEPRALFHYKPGQFVSIELVVQGQVLRRCYSISSSPSRPYTLSITVKRVPKGWMSNWLFDNMVEGMECTIDGPLGKFTCVDYPAEKLLFVTAGSGITPAMSMLRWLVDTASATDVVFINNVRTPDDIIFREELSHLSSRLGDRLRSVIVPAATAPGQSWNGAVSKINELLLRLHAPDFLERETFVCGPPGYTAAVKSLLATLGFPMNRYHEESFGGPQGASPAITGVQTATGAPVVIPMTAPTPVAAEPGPILAESAATMAVVATTMVPVPKPTPANAPAASPIALISKAPSLKVPVAMAPSKAARIQIEGSGTSFNALTEQTILEAAEASGVMLEHSCRSGVCGGCKMRKVSGLVEMSDQTVLSSADVDSGIVLTCIGRATGDVILSTC